MNTETEVVRTLQVDEKTIHVHIHLTEEELRRVLLPLVTDAFAQELRMRTPVVTASSSGGTRAWRSAHDPS